MGIVKDLRRLVNNISEMRRITEKKYRRTALFIPLGVTAVSLYLFMMSLFSNIELLGFDIVLLIGFVILSFFSTFFLIYFFHLMFIKNSTSDFELDELLKWR